jgi:hypothetical protein
MGVLLSEIIISLPKDEEYVTGLKFDIIFIQEGKFSDGNNAVLENIRGRLIKLDTTVGICQSELFIVISRYMDERPKLRRKSAVTKAASPSGSAIDTPNSITPRNTIGTWIIPRVEDPITFARKIIKFLVGVTITLLRYPDFLSWMRLSELNIPTNNIEAES